MPLTDTAVRQAKPAAKPTKLSDGRGLYLLVTPTGSRLWRWKYRFQGKEKLMPLGQYPDVTLARARAACEDARRLLSEGSDPMERRKVEKLAKLSAADDAFETVARQWWQHWKGPSKAPERDLKPTRRLTKGNGWTGCS